MYEVQLLIHSGTEQIYFRCMSKDVWRLSLFAASCHQRWKRCFGLDVLGPPMSPVCVCLCVIFVHIHGESQAAGLPAPTAGTNLSVQLDRTMWSAINQTSRGARTAWTGNQSTWTSACESVPPAGELRGNSRTRTLPEWSQWGYQPVRVTAAGLAASWLRVQPANPNGKPFSLHSLFSCCFFFFFFLFSKVGGSICLSAVVGVDRRMKRKREGGFPQMVFCNLTLQ